MTSSTFKWNWTNLISHFPTQISLYNDFFLTPHVATNQTATLYNPSRDQSIVRAMSHLHRAAGKGQSAYQVIRRDYLYESSGGV